LNGLQTKAKSQCLGAMSGALLMLGASACDPGVKNNAPVVDGWLEKSALASDHIVQPKESIYSIAWQYGLDYQDLASANQLTPPYPIHIGQRIKFSGMRSFEKMMPAKTKPAKPASDNPWALSFKPVNQWHWPVLKNSVLTHALDPITQGLDITVKGPQGVLAAADGKVVYSGRGFRGYGNLLIIKHNDEFLSAYANNHRLLVEEQTWVKAGQRIAEIGDTGSKTAKLHFEIRRAGKSINPLEHIEQPPQA